MGVGNGICSGCKEDVATGTMGMLTVGGVRSWTFGRTGHSFI